MSYSAEIIDYKGKEAIELTAGKYKAVVAPFLGSNVLRMQDVENDIEIFRYDESLSIEDLKKSPEVYGLPTLYLPNRLAGGVLKVSDATYHFPLNDPLGNHIHGFLHKREHKIVSVAVEGTSAVAKTEYVYDKNDEFFETYPVSFKAEFTFTLSDDGLDYAFTMTNRCRMVCATTQRSTVLSQRMEMVLICACIFRLVRSGSFRSPAFRQARCFRRQTTTDSI